MPILYLSLAWLTGIIAGEWLNWTASVVLLGLAPISLLLLAHRRWKKIVTTSLCLVIFLGAASYSAVTRSVVDENHIQSYNEKGTVEIRGLVSGDPEEGDRATRLRLSNLSIGQDGGWREVSGSALLLVPRYPGYRYGDVLLAKGKVETPPVLDDPSTPLRTGFDYRGYLANQGIYSIMSFPRIETLEAGQGFTPLGWVYDLRQGMSQALAKVLPEPQASVAQGMVLGLRGGIPTTIREEFNRTGTAHLMAISGLNIGIVAGILVSLGIALFGRRHYLYVWLALGMIWLYALVTGLNAPVVRAAIMASFFFAADLAGRQRSSLIALVFAAALMAGVDPCVIRDASFQMSFMAMAGLFFITPRLQSVGRKLVDSIFQGKETAVSAANFMVDSLSVSLGAIMAVWPLIAYYFGMVSWVGPIATFLAALSLPGIIVSGVLGGIIGIFFLPFAQVIVWIVWVFVSYLLLVVKIFDVAPVSHLESFDGRLVWAYYGVLAATFWLTSNRVKLAGWVMKTGDLAAQLPGKKWVASGLLLVTVLVWLTAVSIPDNRLRVTFLDIGQGDAILISRGNQQVLVDGGPSPRAISLALGRQMPFWDRTIDLVVMTHPHADHATGLLEVLRRYRVKQVLYSAQEDTSPLYRQWLSETIGNGVSPTVARAGQRITIGDVVIDVLSPPNPPLKGTDSDGDNNGVVLRVRAGKVSFLLTADVMWEAELELVSRRAVLPSTVIKAGHHGSATSTSPGFLAVAKPQVAVISAGAGNEFGHPDRQVLARLEEAAGRQNVYRTDEQGDIRFTTDGKRLWVITER
ncbi:MAG: DNA internalization-related competence protein ComEC/Rec2 [Chloroflexi bacterium]|nr:DNA internalization-related competence protein ComEC/Rec2 [Chloroflexota bacterium]